MAFSRIGLNSLAAFGLFFFYQDKMVDLEHGLTLNVVQEGQRTVELFNDVKAAIEVNLGEGWHILYPEKSLKFELGDFPVKVRLRDDPGICGQHVLGHEWVCRPHPQVIISQAFGEFGRHAARFLENEEGTVKRERGRKDTLAKLHLEEIFWRRMRILGTAYFVVLCIWGMTVLLFINLEQTLILNSEITAIFQSFLTGYTARGSLVLSFRIMFISVVYEQTERDIKFGNGQDGSDIFLARALLASFRCQSSVWTTVAIFTSVGLMDCVIVWQIGSIRLFANYEDHPWAIVISWSLPCCSCICYLIYELGRKRLSTKECLSQIRETTACQTLKFNGNVIPDRSKPCVCSWPGKYEAAWQHLVDRSYNGQISAAVVFLPKGSRNFGQHDSIPSSEGLEGNCWCWPLYGKQKPWGCRWWSLWVENIEKAVCCGVELQVFFFEHMKGQGKVQSFATAGAEHCQRERVWQKKKEFEASADYREAVAAGLDSLSKDVGEDSSSQHSREFQRLFLAWLSQEDRDFLTASEGLGNSQKAEVAWLERKGYQYTEVDIIQFNRSFMGVQDDPDPSPIGEQSQGFTQQRAKRKHVGAA